eukprot:761361_1
MENIQSVKVFESLASMPNEQKSRFLEYISDVMGEQCSETGKISEDMLASWGARWIFVLEHPIGTVIGTGFILRPSDSSKHYTLSGLCYDPSMIQCIESILEAAVKVRNYNFPSHTLVVELAHDNTKMQQAVEKFGFSSESSGSEDLWIRYSARSEVPEASHGVQPMKVESKSPDEGFNCGECEKSFDTDAILQRRSVVHSDDRPHSCNQCDTNDALTEHMVYVHSSENHFESNECHKRFSTDTVFSKHVKSIHPGQRDFECSQCDKLFESRSKLKYHCVTHLDDRPFSCDQCDKRFKTPYHLKYHSVVHSDDRPYTCNQCDKKFKRKYELIGHMVNVHASEKHFECKECHKRFSTPKVRSRHVKAVHPAQCDFECSQCDKRFKSRSTLKQHSVVHSDVRPHSCDQCDKRFKTPYHLKYHSVV